MSTSCASNATVSSQKCCLCNNFLSVPPIMTTSLEEEQYKCGRCHLVACKTYTRNHLFESLAQNLSFPCSYPKCDEKIPWNWVDVHENNCSHRTIKCPIYYQNCYEVVLVKDLEKHFNEKHRKNIKIAENIWEVDVTLDYVFLIQVEGHKFFVYILHLDDIFSIAVLALNDSRYTKFSVELLPTTGDNLAVTFSDLLVSRYNERSHCYMCIRKRCKEPHHPYSQKGGIELVDLSSFARKLRKEFIDNVKSSEGKLRYQIKLIPDETIIDQTTANIPLQTSAIEHHVEQTGGSQNKTPPQTTMESIRSCLCCPYCMTFMASPIFTCSTGHTICNVCRPRYDKCPTCAAPITNSRNFSLEKMAEEVQVSCIYDFKGCTFVGKSSKMFFHEQDCVFSSLLRE